MGSAGRTGWVAGWALAGAVALTVAPAVAQDDGMGRGVSAGGAAQERGVDALAWPAGCWALRGRVLVEEQWMTPRGGVMVGMSRTVRDGRAVAWEALRIDVEEGRLVYHAAPSGQAPADFPATDVAPGRVAFENPAHDFPQRIVYALAGDSLHARVEGEVEGTRRGSDFRYGRVACPGGAPPPRSP